mmetsp:Transcript_129475/g.258460  ORF Transcript_129475/g.258460 Transcript_129475/m.258460 type:complete len:205 (-) Transcript_129475:78-692(-)
MNCESGFFSEFYLAGWCLSIKLHAFHEWVGFELLRSTATIIMGVAIVHDYNPYACQHGLAFWRRHSCKQLVCFVNVCWNNHDGARAHWLLCTWHDWFHADVAASIGAANLARRACTVIRALLDAGPDHSITFWAEWVQLPAAALIAFTDISLNVHAHAHAHVHAHVHVIHGISLFHVPACSHLLCGSSAGCVPCCEREGKCQRP